MITPQTNHIDIVLVLKCFKYYPSGETLVSFCGLSLGLPLSPECLTLLDFSGLFWVPVVPGSGVANHLAMALEEQYIKDPVEKDQLFDAIHTMPAVRDKARWLGRIWKSHEVCVAKGGSK